MTTSGPDDCLLPSDKYWLTFNCEGSSVIFKVPHVNGRNLKTMTLCIVYFSSSDTITSESLKNGLIINYTKSTIHVYKRDTLASLEDEEWQNIISNLEPGNSVEVLLVGFGYGFIVKKTTVYLIYDEPIDQYMAHSHLDVIVSGGNYIVSDSDDMAIDKNLSISGGDDVAANKKCSCFWW